MAVTSMGGYSGQNVMLKRNDSSSDSLAAMLGPCSPPVALQAPRRVGACDDGGLVQAIGGGQKRPFFATYDGPTVEDGPELDGEELGGGDECSGGGQLEKKRRLTFDQVRSLERNFEMENKLEPERKMQLAKELGLRPRQVAVWFQNRRARWKTKQLERDYETLAADYKRLKADYEQVLGEKNHLKIELQRLSGDAPVPSEQGNDDGLGPRGVEFTQTSQGDHTARQHTARASPTVDVSLAKEETSSGSTDGNSSSDLLNADSPRTTDSSSLSAIQSPDFPPESCCFIAHGDHLLPDPNAVKLEDGSPFPEDQSCNYLLLHLDDHSGVLPWWDWP